MIQWWNGLNTVQHFFAYVAIPATLILILQTILLIFGMGSGSDVDDDIDFENCHDDCDIDHDSLQDSGLRIFSIRAFVAFFSVFGWAGIVMTKEGHNELISIATATVLGFLSMVFIAIVMKSATKLQSSGNINAINSIGKSGTVYISIPEKRTAKGKVMILIQGRLTEMEAVTDYDYKLKSGTEVTVVSISNQGTLCVIPK